MRTLTGIPTMKGAGTSDSPTLCPRHLVHTPPFTANMHRQNATMPAQGCCQGMEHHTMTVCDVTIHPALYVSEACLSLSEAKNKQRQ